MTEIELLIDFYKNTDRQGPGSTVETLQALSFINLKNDKKLKVADIGCGSGGQTITLAMNLEGDITAIDLYPEFLDELNTKAKELGYQKKLKQSQNQWMTFYSTIKN